jgi:hypothetical protein
MRKHGSPLGLALLCALAFCAFGAASASASGTTAFTCVQGGNEDFEDPHCDNNVGTGNGEYGHVEIAAEEETTVTGTNNLTGSETSSLSLKGNIGGTVVEFRCETVHVHGALTNVAGPPMKVIGEGTLNVSNCMLLVPATQTNNCRVSIAPATGTSETTGMENILLPMGGSTAFTSVTISDETGHTCSKALKGTFNVEGSAKVTGLSTGETPTWSGATLHFTTADTAGTLEFAGHSAELEGTLTFKMAPSEGVEENPIVFTTE